MSSPTMRVLLGIALGCGSTGAAAQGSVYPEMAAVERYMMDRSAELQLARSAAPGSIAGDAEILVLGPRGFETAVEGTNGFVCMVDRAWNAAFDWPEFWNPSVRAPACLNPQAASAIVPIATLRSRMVLAGRSTPEVVAALRAGFESGQLSAPGNGAMIYMQSKSGYLTDTGQNAPHLMFLVEGADAGDWGANAPGSPVLAAPYWFFSPEAPADREGLPPILVFLVGTTTWSDGTPAAEAPPP